MEDSKVVERRPERLLPPADNLGPGNFLSDKPGILTWRHKSLLRPPRVRVDTKTPSRGPQNTHSSFSHLDISICF